MVEDMLLILVVLASAAGIFVAKTANIMGLVLLCAIIYTSAIFWMGVRSGRNN
jgi:hypothetical protein